MEKDFIIRNKQGRLSKKVKKTAEFKTFEERYYEATKDPRITASWFTIFVWHYFPDSWYSKWRRDKLTNLVCEKMGISRSEFDLKAKYL